LYADLLVSPSPYLPLFFGEQDAHGRTIERSSGYRAPAGIRSSGGVGSTLESAATAVTLMNATAIVATTTATRRAIVDSSRAVRVSRA